MSSTNESGEAVIICSNGNFLVFDKESVLKLRRNRIVGQLIGCSPVVPHQLVESGFPYLLSQYAAKLVLEKSLGEFKRIVFDGKASSEQDNAKRFRDCLEKLQVESEEKYRANRIAELASRNLEVTPNRMGRFDKTKLRLKVESSTSNLEPIDIGEVKKQIKVDEEKFLVFKDLHQRGFYTTSGIKFGCDLLCYVNDPVRYHAQYAVRVVPNGKKNLTNPLCHIDYNEINALNRLTRGAKKTLLLACVDKNSMKISYFTVPERQYLDSGFGIESFQSIEPTPKDNPGYLIEEPLEEDKTVPLNLLESCK